MILLDNLEQVIDAAPLLGQLLERAPGLTLLATSRLALRLRGERAYPLLPRRVPLKGASEVELLQPAAAALFVERARSTSPGFALNAQTAPVIA
jgi:predicted ATPase